MRYALILWILIISGCAGGGAGARKQDEGERVDLFQVRQLAEASYAARDYTESEKQYAVLVQRAPIEAENWFRLGNICARTNRPDQAITYYREALVRAPDHQKAWYNMAILQINSAINSLTEFQKHANPADPVGDRSREVLKELQRLIQSGPSSDTEAAAAASAD